MSIIIIVDMRESNGSVCGIMDDKGNLAQYETMEEAQKVQEWHPLGAFTWAYLDLDNGDIELG